MIGHRFRVPALFNFWSRFSCMFVWCRLHDVTRRSSNAMRGKVHKPVFFVPSTADWRRNIHSKWSKRTSRPCHSSGGLWPSSHHCGPSSIPGQVIWDLCWAKWHRDTFSVLLLILVPPTAPHFIYQLEPQSKSASGRRTNPHVKGCCRILTLLTLLFPQGRSADVRAGTVHVRDGESSEWNRARWKELVPFHWRMRLKC